MGALSFDFDLILPTKYLQSLNEILVERSIEIEVFRFSKIFLLDLVRCGISLFYSPVDLMIASVFLAHYSISGSLFFVFFFYLVKEFQSFESITKFIY